MDERKEDKKVDREFVGGLMDGTVASMHEDAEYIDARITCGGRERIDKYILGPDGKFHMKKGSGFVGVERSAVRKYEDIDIKKALADKLGADQDQLGITDIVVRNNFDVRIYYIDW